MTGLYLLPALTYTTNELELHDGTHHAIKGQDQITSQSRVHLYVMAGRSVTPQLDSSPESLPRVRNQKDTRDTRQCEFTPPLILPIGRRREKGGYPRRRGDAGLGADITGPQRTFVRLSTRHSIGSRAAPSELFNWQ